MAEADPLKGKVELPSSGLAEDILGKVRADARPEEAAPAGGAAMREYAGEDGGSAQEETLHLVSFFLNAEEYALDISLVREIIRVSGWTRVPNSPDYIKGVINLRGRIIPVVDPKVKMGLEETPLTKSARVMVVEAGPKTIGILVDMVRQVLKLPRGVIEPPPEEVSGTDRGYIKGVGKMGERLVILLELDKITGREAKHCVSA